MTGSKANNEDWKENVMENLKSIKGVGSSTAEKLFKNGFVSQKMIALTPPRQLEEEGGIGEKTSRKLVKRLRQRLNLTYKTALELLKERKKVERIPTGSEELDDLLGGGIETGSLTEIYGEFRTGKTQISHHLAVTTVLSEKNGKIEGKEDVEGNGEVNGKALFVDTEGTFRPERIVPIAEAHDMDPDTALENIIVARAFSADQQVKIGKKLKSIIPKKNIKTVIVDSLTNRFRSEYVGRGVLAERQQKINQHLHDLYRVANVYNVAVLGTNQVLTDPDTYFGNPTRPVGGNVLGHNVTHRIWVRKSKGSKRVAKIVDSPVLPESEAVFKITDEGIKDA